MAAFCDSQSRPTHERTASAVVALTFSNHHAAPHTVFDVVVCLALHRRASCSLPTAPGGTASRARLSLRVVPEHDSLVVTQQTQCSFAFDARLQARHVFDRQHSMMPRMLVVDIGSEAPQDMAVSAASLHRAWRSASAGTAPGGSIHARGDAAVQFTEKTKSRKHAAEAVHTATVRAHRIEIRASCVSNEPRDMNRVSRRVEIIGGVLRV